MPESVVSVTRVPYAIKVLLLAGAYFATAKLSLLLAIPPGYATAVWPPSGIALAALLLLGSRVWPGVWLGAALANLTVETSPLAAILIGTGNTLEALAGATLVQRFIGVPRRFVHAEDVVTFIAAAALSAAIAATVAMIPLMLNHPMSQPDVFWNWLTWLQGDAAGMIIVTPLILTWSAHDDAPWTQAWAIETAGFFALLLLSSLLIFSQADTYRVPMALPFMIVPFMIWAAFRLGQREITAAVAVVYAIAAWYTVAGHGPFVSLSLNDSLLALLIFICVLAATGLVLNAVLGERGRITDELRKRHAELESRVEERTRALEQTNRALHLDIVERERMEKLLVESELRFRTLIESVQDYAIFMLDPEGRVMSWNEGAEKIKGYTASEIIGRSHACFYPGAEESGKPARVLDHALRHGHHEDEGWRVCKDGSAFWANVIITALRDEAGTLRGFGNVTRNLTRRMETEAALRASEERFRLMVDTVTDYAIFMLDVQGHVTSWNAGAQRINGYSADEILGQHYSRFFLNEDIEAGKPVLELATAAATGRCMDEGWRKRRDGSRFWAHVVVTAVRDDAGRLLGFSKVTRDLSERKRAEIQMEDARAAAEKANQAKSEFLAKMSHELRTPLNSLLILARLLADNASSNLTPKQVQYAETIHGAGLDLLALINDILDLARIESGAITELDITGVRFTEIQDYVEGTFGQLARQKGLRFVITIDERLPAAIRTDGRRLQQVLKNLLSNAFKFTRQGGVSLHMAPATSGWKQECAALSKAETVVAFSVMDTGIGIAEGKQELIFEPFQQADGTTSRQFGGTGLGLSISREFTRLLGGDIRIDSSPGRGSTFTLYLPLEHKPAAGTTESEASVPQHRAA